MNALFSSHFLDLPVFPSPFFFGLSLFISSTTFFCPFVAGRSFAPPYTPFSFPLLAFKSRRYERNAMR